MIEIKDASLNEAPKKRPTGLSILFVMTMISTGWQLLGFLAGVISRKASSEDIENVKLKYADLIKFLRGYGTDEDFEPILRMENVEIAIIENLQLFSFLGILFAATGLYGALKMYQGLKQGFHFYIIYSFLSLVHYHFVIGASEIPLYVLTVNGGLSLFLIYLYSRYLNWMK